MSFWSGPRNVKFVRARDVIEIRDRGTAITILEAMVEQLGEEAVRELVGTDEAGLDLETLSDRLLDGSLVVVRHGQMPRSLDAPRATPLSDLVDPEDPVHPLEVASHALEIALLEENGTPIGGARYSVTPPGGSPIMGRLDTDGRARLERLPAGVCRVEFPDLPYGAVLLRAEHLQD